MYTSEKTPRPLEGVNVLDVTQLWAGPMVTRMLGHLGATVIKVETPNRPDSLRTLGSDLPQRYPNSDPGTDPRNRNAWFNTQNHDKLGLIIDLKTPEGLGIMEKLAAHCQVFVANSRAGVMERLGLGYRRYRELRGKDAVYVEMSAFGSTGERSHLAGFGLQFEAASGAPMLIGGTDAPTLTGYALADAAGGIVTATSVVTALERARQSGHGAYIETSLAEAYMTLLGDVYLESSAGYPVDEMYGDNKAPDAAPYGVYRISGPDEFVAIGIDSNEQWDCLVEKINIDSLRRDEYSDVEYRLKEQENIRALIQQWVDTASTANEVVESLQAVGVPASKVASSADVANDSSLQESGYFREVTHPSTGTHSYPGLPYLFNGQYVPIDRPAPRWGEDTASILRDVIGLPAEQIDDLADRGIIFQHHGDVSHSSTFERT